MIARYFGQITIEDAKIPEECGPLQGCDTTDYRLVILQIIFILAGIVLALALIRKWRKRK